MFERYTELARRTLFFARYEASRLADRSIDTEHLLLAVLRLKQGLADRVLSEHRLTYDDVASSLTRKGESEPSLPTSVEIPFTEEMKRVLFAAMKESDRLGHRDIDVEHLVLGLLHEPDSAGARILREHGLTLDGTRDRIVTLLNDQHVLEIVRTETDELLEMVDHIELALDGLLADLPERAPEGQRLLSLVRALRQRLEGRRQ